MRSWLAIAWLAVSIACAAGCVPPSAESPPRSGAAAPAATAPRGVRTARIVRVEDGDTVVIEGGERVRYLAVDAPERDDPYYREAAGENRRLVEGKTVELARGGPEETDRYGRALAVVRVMDATGAEVCVNEALVRAGLASVYITGPDAVDREYLALLLAAQRDAIRARRGVWAARLAKEPPPGTLVSTRFRIHRANCPEAKAGKPRAVSSLAGELSMGKSLCRSCNPLQ